MKRVLGEDNADTLCTANNLAYVIDMQVILWIAVFCQHSLCASFSCVLFLSLSLSL